MGQVIHYMQSGNIVVLVSLALACGLWLTGCASSSNISTRCASDPNYALFYQKPTEADLHAVREELTQLKVGMTREVVQRELKPMRLLSIHYHGADAQNTYWLRPGIKVTLHFSNRDPLLAVPDELPRGEPDDVLLDLPEYISVAAGPDGPNPPQSWQTVGIAVIN